MARSPLVAPRRAPKGRKPTRAKDTPTRKRRRTRSRRPRGPLGWLLAPVLWALRLLGRLAWRGALAGALILALAVGYVYTTLPAPEALLDGRARGSVTLLDRDGEIFAWRGEQFGGQISAATVSPYLREAIIATEDRRFYLHPGVDPIGIASAVRINLREGRGPLSGHGGSTLTQQTAKLLCVGQPYDPDVWESEADYEADCRATSLWRKVKEAVYALALELRYTKGEILTIYMNRVFLGAGSRGFEAAAQRYFGKSANEVDPAEAAMLAGLLVAPTRYAPTANLQRSQERASVIVSLMEEQGYLTAAEAKAALEHPAELSAAAEARAGGYFADWVMSTAPDFLTRKTTEDIIMRTTFDPRIQRAAELALEDVFNAKVRDSSEAQAAIVVMSADGAVRAMVGGRKFKGVAGQFNRAIQARRQTGSAFKPFVYAAAMEMGYSPLDTVMDEPLNLSVPGSGTWSPENYDHRFHGRVTLAQALQESLNIPAVKVSEAVGRENVRKIASDFGIEFGPGGRAVAGARRLRIDASGNDRRLCRDPERRQLRGALRHHRPPPAGRRPAADRQGRRPRRAGDLGTRGAPARLHDEPRGRRGHRRPRGSGRPPGGRQDRHDLGGARRLVPGLHRRLRHRRLDGLRRQHAADRRHRRRLAGGDLARGDGAHP